MSLRILYVTATETEGDTLMRLLKPAGEKGVYEFRGNNIELLVTGVGPVATAWSLTKRLAADPRPDIVINGGIAGSYRDDIRTGAVLFPLTDTFADTGIEDHEKRLTMFDAGLADPDGFPFSGGVLRLADDLFPLVGGLCPSARAITVSRASGSEKTIAALRADFDPDIETMEGAALFYVCLAEKVPFVALRAVSNKVEPRNRAGWNTRLALDNLSVVLEKLLIKLDGR
jgi:futalosine hydrolase